MWENMSQSMPPDKHCDQSIALTALTILRFRWQSGPLGCPKKLFALFLGILPASTLDNCTSISITFPFLDCFFLSWLTLHSMNKELLHIPVLHEHLHICSLSLFLFLSLSLSPLTFIPGLFQSVLTKLFNSVIIYSPSSSKHVFSSVMHKKNNNSKECW